LQKSPLGAEKKEGAIFVHRHRKPFGNIVVGLKEAGKGRCSGLKNSILSLEKKELGERATW